MYNDTALIRMVIDILAKKNNWSYEKTMDLFYTSVVCQKLSNERMGLFTCAPIEIAELFQDEMQL